MEDPSPFAPISQPTTRQKLEIQLHFEERHGWQKDAGRQAVHHSDTANSIRLGEKKSQPWSEEGDSAFGDSA